MEKTLSFCSALCLWMILLTSTFAVETIGEAIDVEIQALKDALGTVTRQVIMQQFATEERVRSEGDSGIKRVRMMKRGTRPYYSESFARGSVAAIHDHSNAERTVGMGEVIAVQNGIEFRTRHNDYLLRMPSTSSSKYHAMEDIEFPSVPAAVTSKSTVEERIIEMREWFRAFMEQDYSVRDYRPYFKPILCYMEGAWTITNKAIEEPFASERHALDAISFYNLQQKVRFTSYTGSKSNFENLAYLPVKIMGMINDTAPQFAQWNYRILCNPLKDDLPLDRLSVVDDLSTRMALTQTMSAFQVSRAARYQLAIDSENPFEHDDFSYGLLDKLMRQIPGKENHGGDITDTGLGLTAYDYEFQNNNTALNAAFYHRIFKANRRGAMGTSKVNRGFSDQNLFVALTTQEKVAAITANQCKRTSCTEYSQRVSYAFPLEIIFLTPLQSWNPYNLLHKGSSSSAEGKTVTQGGERNGDSAVDKAFNGTNSRVFYRIPAEFFSGGEINRDSADTTKTRTYVLDQNDIPRKVSASGVRIILPNIDGVGIIRQRYPIMPVHDEGSNTRKELEALKDVVLDLASQKHMIRDPPDFYNLNGIHDAVMKLETGLATRSPPGNHTHNIFLTPADLMVLAQEGSITKYTTEDKGHTHLMEIDIRWKKYHIKECDGRGSSKCWHHHGSYYLTKVE